MTYPSQKVFDKAKAEYESAAKAWNELPGSKLYRDKDAFKWRYCRCDDKTPTRMFKKKTKIHDKCGYSIPSP